MLVGLTCSGKTSCYEILADVMTKIFRNGCEDKRY